MTEKFEMEKISLKNNPEEKERKFKFHIPKFRLQNLLLYYSTFIMTISLIGGIYSIRHSGDIFLNLLFLPVAVYLWRRLIKHRRKKNKK